MAASCPDPFHSSDGPGILSNTRAVLVVPSDTEYLAAKPKFLRIGYNAGASGPARSDVTVEYADGSQETLSVVPGQQVNCRPVRVRSTGLTAGVVIYACY